MEWNSVCQQRFPAEQRGLCRVHGGACPLMSSAVTLRNVALRTYQFVAVISPSGSKKCLQNTPQCDSFSGLRASETSEDNGTYWTSDLGLLDGLRLRGLRVAKSFRKSAID